MRKQQPNLRRRTFFTPLLMPILGGMVVVGLLAWLHTNITTTTVVLVRHAEKLSDDERDPGLTPAGEARAKMLAGMLVRTDVKALYASEFRRTRQTLAPLAAAKGIPVETVDAATPAVLVEKIFAEHRGDTVVIAGHSNTLPELIRLLADFEIAVIDESDYSGIYVLSLPRFGEPRVLQLVYPDWPVEP